MNQDFRDLLRAFNEEKVKYLIVGGYALIKFETNFLSRVDLIVNKEAVGRKQDLADVEKLRISEIRETNN